MPRQARLDAPGTLHHVMIRGIEGANIFGDDKDREHFLSRVGEIGKATETRILAWALMDNHVHMLLFSGSSGLPRFMRRLLTGYMPSGSTGGIRDRAISSRTAINQLSARRMGISWNWSGIFT